MKSEFNILKEKSNKYADRFCKSLKRYGIDFATGVPCGVQRLVIYNLSHDPDVYHLSATRESEAIGIAAGAYLAGKKPVVYMQNSGLFDCSNDISSLLIQYRIPVLLSVSWRGCPGEDAPQHFVTGKATMPLLDSIGVPHQVVEKENIEEVVSNAFKSMEEKQIPATILIKRGTFV